VITYITQDFRKGNFLPYDSIRGSIVLSPDEPHISRHIDLGRTGIAAGDKGSFTALSLGKLLLVHNGPCGTHFSAGTAEAASRFSQREPFFRTDKSLFASLLVKKNAASPKLMACPHTPSAEDAFVGVMEKERIRRGYRKKL
jgi:hypothetical protein